MLPWEVSVVVFAYAVGSLNAGYYWVRWRDGRDLRVLGSGNAGARNAGRIFGRGAFAIVFALDAAKGLLAVLDARTWAPDLAPLCAVAATLGHVYPAQLGWRGGKGVATAIGGLAALDTAVLGVTAAAFAVARPMLGRTLAAGMVAFVAGAVVSLVFRPADVGFATLMLAGLLCFTHLGPSRRGDAADRVDRRQE
jgi:glycerol-3-phosphate acyltransferase PlsY